MWIRAVFVIITGLHSASVLGQGMRVSTNVYDLANRSANGREQIVSSSLSLFHNGRVYDYIDAADEVVIFNPLEKKFTVLNVARELSTVVSFEEIRHLLDSRVPAVEQYIQDLNRQQNPNAKNVADSLRFQLKPEFRSDFDASTETLTLTSPSWTYRAATQRWSDADQVEKYLSYCDWTARLNHILHPRSLFPEPRLELNLALRNLKDRMPVRVELNLQPNEPLHLRAEHHFTLDLDEHDRRRIARWDQSLTSPKLRKMSFRNYQQTLLLSDRR